MKPLCRLKPHLRRTQFLWGCHGQHPDVWVPNVCHIETAICDRMYLISYWWCLQAGPGKYLYWFSGSNDYFSGVIANTYAQNRCIHSTLKCIFDYYSFSVWTKPKHTSSIQWGKIQWNCLRLYVTSFCPNSYSSDLSVDDSTWTITPLRGRSHTKHWAALQGFMGWIE